MRRKIKEGGWLYICLVAKGWKIGLGETITIKEVGALEMEEKGFCSSMARHSYKTCWAYANEFLIRVTITRGGKVVSFG